MGICMHRWIDRCMGVCMYRWMDGLSLDAWLYARMDGWVYAWMDGCVHV